METKYSVEFDFIFVCLKIKIHNALRFKIKNSSTK